MHASLPCVQHPDSTARRGACGDGAERLVPSQSCSMSTETARPARVLLSQVEQDDMEALLRETSGVMEKLAEGNLKLFSWQMVLWQPRWVKAEPHALCYQKITADERPVGKEKRIEFSTIREIEELEYGEFVLQCGKRDYTFKAPDEQTCEVFVGNLRQLIERWRADMARQKREISVTVKGGNAKQK